MYILLSMLVNYVLVQQATSSGYNCKYVKTYDLNSQKHSVGVIYNNRLEQKNNAKQLNKTMQNIFYVKPHLLCYTVYQKLV
mgnify:CR=1 FL=1